MLGMPSEPAEHKHYKIWIVIEECDEENDEYNDTDMPESLGTFDTLAAAQCTYDRIVEEQNHA